MMDGPRGFNQNQSLSGLEEGKMRNFKCRKCNEVDTLKAWNTSAPTYGKLTLHEIKDWDTFDSWQAKERVLFTCPSCREKSIPNDIEEIL